MKQILIITALSLSGLLFSCKGEKGEPGPAGPVGPMPTEENYIPPKEGYVKGKFITSIEKTPTEIDIDFQGIYYNPSSYTISENGLTIVTISKFYAKDGDKIKDGYFSISFSVKDLVSLANPTVGEIELSIQKEMPNNKFYEYYSYRGIGSKEPVYSISNLKFSPSTNIIEGKFTFTNYRNINENGVVREIVSSMNGTFSSKILQDISNLRRSN